MKDTDKDDLISEIMMYESGELDDMGVLNLFSKLIKNGMAWSLQGHYGRTAESLIDNGLIHTDGYIDHEVVSDLMMEA